MSFLLIFLLKIVDFEKKLVQFAMKLEILLAFKNLHEDNMIFKVVAFIFLIEFHILNFLIYYLILIELCLITWFNKDLHFKFTCFHMGESFSGLSLNSGFCG